jgi:uncharacterized protein
MTSRYLKLLSSDTVKAEQMRQGSRDAYARFDDDAEMPDTLGEAEAAFIAARDSFYLATSGADGWPYLQHRGGPPGFVRVIDGRTLAVADFRGNRQYISVGNAATNDKASLFFMDYARRRRLKVLARVKTIALEEDDAIARLVATPGYKARIERALVFDVEAFDWNCPQHITPRYSLAEIEPTLGALKQRIAELESELAVRAVPAD